MKATTHRKLLLSLYEKYKAAVSVCLILIISVLVPFSLLAQGAADFSDNLFTDDFARTGADDIWTEETVGNTYVSLAPEKSLPHRLDTTTFPGNSVFVTARNTNQNRYSFLTTINDSKWNGFSSNGTKSVKRMETVFQVTGNFGWSSGPIAFAYTNGKNEALGMEFSYTANYETNSGHADAYNTANGKNNTALMARWWRVYSKTGAIGLNQLAGANAVVETPDIKSDTSLPGHPGNTPFVKGEWIKLVYTYTYKDANTMNIAATLESVSNSAIRRDLGNYDFKFATGNYAESVYNANAKPGFGSAATGSDVVFYDSISIDFGSSGGTSSGGTSSGSTSSGSTSSGTGTGKPANGLHPDPAETFTGPAFRSDDFNYTDTTAAKNTWITVDGQQMRGAPDMGANGDFIITNYDGRKVMRPAYGNSPSSSLMTTVRNRFWDTSRTVESLETVFRLGGPDNLGVGSNASIFAYQIDSTEALILELFTDANGIVGVRWQALYNTGVTPNGENGAGSGENGCWNRGPGVDTYYTGISKEDWVKLKLSYEYAPNKIIVTGTTSKEDGSSPVTKSITVDFATSARPHSVYKSGWKVGIGSISNGNALAYFSSFNVNYTKGAAEKADEFKLAHSGILGKTTSSVTLADTALLKAALDDFDALDKAAQDYLKDNDTAYGHLSDLVMSLYSSDWNTFVNAHGELLTLKVSEVKLPDDRSRIQAAYNAFSALPDLLKRVKSVERNHLANLYNESLRRDDDDLSPFNDSFETGVGQWKLFARNSERGALSAVKDNTLPGSSVDNTVAKLDGNGVFFAASNTFWPSKGGMTSVSFNWKAQNDTVYNPARDGMDGNAATDAPGGNGNGTNPLSSTFNGANPYCFVYSFVDTNNFYALYTTNGNLWRATGFRDGSKVDIMGNDIITSKNDKGPNDVIDIWDWCQVKFTYNASGAVLFNITDGNGTGNSYTPAINLPSFPNGRLVLGYAQNGNGLFEDENNGTLFEEDGKKYRRYNPAGPCYYDDIHVEFKEGDWDTNETITDIIPYYNSNVWVNPGQSVNVSGERLGEVLKKAELMRLPDGDAGSVASYVTQTSYYTDGTFGKTTKGLSNAAIEADVWEQSKSIELNVYHKTRESILFLIPKKDYNGGIMTSGIYVLKMTPNDPLSDPFYMYINSPQLRYVMGDQGDTSTNGGWLRFIGSNLVPPDSQNASKITAFMKRIGGVETYPLTNPEIHDDDAYSLKFDVSGVAEGEYEVFTHSPYGDKTAWSAPCTVKVGKDPRASWPHGENDFFSLSDFGANGDERQNATPYMTKALEALAKNGGGVLYVPPGTYFLHEPMIVPPNVTIRGEGSRSVLLFSASTWQYGELPDSLIMVEHDVEIKNVQVFCNRVYNLIKTYPSGDEARRPAAECRNIYMTDVDVSCYTRMGYVTGGSAETRWTTELTANEVLALTQNECVRSYFYAIMGTNVQMKNVRMDSDRQVQGAACRVSMFFCDYLQIDNCNFMNGTFHGASRYVLVENSKMTDAPAFMARNFSYYYNVYLDRGINGNREALLSGDGGLYNSFAMRKANDKDNISTLPQSLKDAYKENRLYLTDLELNANRLDLSLYVGSGQGSGQTRKYTGRYTDGPSNNRRYFITVDEPFTVEPNRNSTMHLHENRQAAYHVQLTFDDVGVHGAWGTAVDHVYDGIKSLNGAAGPGIDLTATLAWYISFVNSELIGGGYIHSDGRAPNNITGTAKGEFNFHGTLGYAYGRGFLIRNYKFLDGSNIEMAYTTAATYIEDFVIEDCTVESDEYAILAKGRISNYSSIDGLILHNNNFDASPYEMPQEMADCLTDPGNINKFDYPYFMYLDDNAEDGNAPLKGDVNLDGKVSLKDSTLVKLNLMGDWDLSGAITAPGTPMWAADYDGNGIISLVDATRIRKKILEDTP